MRTPLLATLALLSLSAIGCALSPGQVQSDTALGVELMLDTAVRDGAERAGQHRQRSYDARDNGPTRSSRSSSLERPLPNFRASWSIRSRPC